MPGKTLSLIPLLVMMVLMHVAAHSAHAQYYRATAGTLTMKQIDEAIARGVDALYTVESLQPVYTIRSEQSYGRYSWQSKHEMGNHALVSWALLDAGESYQNPPLYRRLNWVFSKDANYSYDRGMRGQMLAQLPYSRWAPWVRRDAQWLTNAITDKGNFPFSYSGGTSTGYGENASGLYGALGLWGVERAGYRNIPRQTWAAIDQYWRGAQDKTDGDLAAGWRLRHPDADPKGAGTNFAKKISGPMTAGAVSSLALTERYLYGSELAKIGANVSINLRKGIRWLDENFSLDDKAEEADWFYYMWATQRVGQASGYRTFNDVDWFRDVTARILGLQKGDGTWSMDKGPLLSTGFALLYLARVHDPLAISKIRIKDLPTAEDAAAAAAAAADAKKDDKDDPKAAVTNAYDGSWNNRPHDIWNFTDFISDEYEYQTTWQIVELDQPVYSLIESPILYLATDKKITLTPKQIQNLKDFIEAGGLLVTNPDGNSPEVALFVKNLAKELYPDFAMQRVEKGHPFFNIHQHLDVSTPIQMVHNGIRPLIIHFLKDIGEDLQKNNHRSNGFRALSNIYLYVTGMNPRRPRLTENYVPQINTDPRIKLQVARIKYNGRYDPEPNALVQLKSILANDHDIDMQISTVTPRELGPHKLAFLTTTGEGDISNQDAAEIRAWVEAGGTLWIDGCGGSTEAADKSLQFLGRIMPNAVATPMSPNGAIVGGKGIREGKDNRRVKWRYFALRRMGPVYTPRLQSVELNERVAIVYSAEDFTCGLAGLDHWNIFGYSVQSARDLVVNGALLAQYNRTPREAPMASGN